MVDWFLKEAKYIFFEKLAFLLYMKGHIALGLHHKVKVSYVLLGYFIRIIENV